MGQDYRLAAVAEIAAFAYVPAALRMLRDGGHVGKSEIDALVLA